MKIAFGGNYIEGFRTLQAIVKRHKVAMIFTEMDDERNREIINLAAGGRIRIFPAAKINDTDVARSMREDGIEVLVCNNFKKIVKRETLNAARFGGINLHSSLLPNYRGRAPISWALIRGEKETGITIHYIDETVDGGNIILQEVIPIRDDDDYRSLLDRNIELEPELVLNALDLVESGFRGTRQDPHGEIFPYITKEMRVVDWSWDSRRIYNLIRALVRPFPGAVTYLGSMEYRIWSGREVESPAGTTGFVPGEITEVSEDIIRVHAARGTIEIRELEAATNGENLQELIKGQILSKGLRFTGSLEA